MTTTASKPEAGLPGPARRPRQGPARGPVAGPVSYARAWVASVRRSFDRPLTSYYLLVGASGLLLTLGLVMVLSASSVWSYEYNGGNSYATFLKQLTWAFLAIPFVWVAVRLPHRVLRMFAWPALLVSVVLLYLTQTSMGVTVNGNRNWLALGPVQIQPAELAKLSVILWCSHIYATKERLLTDWRHTLIPVVPLMFVVIGLVIVGEDLGTALVLMSIVLGLLWVVGAPTKMFVGSILVAGVAALGLAASSPERMDRLTSFADPFARYMAAGITVWITAQMIINIGMVLALLPVIGIPLPLVSYGGSALLPSLVALGLLMSFARNEPGAAAALKAKRRRRSAGVTAGGGLSRRGH